LTGSDFRKHPDPDPNKFSDIFFLKKFMNQKVKQQRFLKYLWLLNILKKFIYCNFLGPGSGSGSDPRHPDPTKKVWIRPKRSGSDRIRIRNTAVSKYNNYLLLLLAGFHVKAIFYWLLSATGISFLAISENWFSPLPPSPHFLLFIVSNRYFIFGNK
jgi:hypothetical protein